MVISDGWAAITTVIADTLAAISATDATGLDVSSRTAPAPALAPSPPRARHTLPAPAPAPTPGSGTSTASGTSPRDGNMTGEVRDRRGT